MKKSLLSEPDFNTACGWWPDLTNYWTTLGWKDHLFRFNVLFDGSLLADPNPQVGNAGYARVNPWSGHSVHLGFCCGYVNDRFSQALYDNNLTDQGWNDDVAPVLFSRWPQNGLMIQQEVFAHVAGGQAVSTGTEPLFAWVRLTIAQLCPGLPLDAFTQLKVQINASIIRIAMSAHNNIRYLADQFASPRKCRPGSQAYEPDRGYCLLEKDGRIRLAVAPKQKCEVQFLPGKPGARDMFLTMTVPTQKGMHVDLLVPIVPTERAVVEAELGLGWTGALRQTRNFWAKQNSTVATVRVPEEPINRIVQRGTQLTQMITERNPADGQSALLSGSLAYVGAWATPNAMSLILTLDMLGHHAEAEKYLRIYRVNQGTVVPPGDFFKLHAGYFSSPKTLTTIDWISDHGAILWSICQHALLSGNEAFVREYLPAILKACEFIRYARGIKGHGGFEGIMPPAVTTDKKTKIQGVWSDGWNYKGLTTAVRLLSKIKHPRAAEFDAEARQYREVFLAALQQKTKTMPQWTDRRGCKHRLVPTSLFGDTPEETRHAFYLDAGPLFLVFAGLLSARHPLMRDTLSWFREGPAHDFFRKESSCWQVPVLIHEMSSCEPAYSWNIFHSWELGDRQHFLEGMYSLFAGALSRKTYSSCETRYGITSITMCIPMCYHARLSVIDDQIRVNELHLLRLVPLKWLSEKGGCAFENMPTEFGPVSLRVNLSRDAKILKVTFRPNFRHPPKRVVLHVPPVPGVRQVVINGRKYAVARRTMIDVIVPA